MAGRQSRPNKPYAATLMRAHDQHLMTQNIYRMWRDFPSLRFGQFILNAMVGTQSSELETFHTALFYRSDTALEQQCFEYWVKHSGRATKKQKEQYDDHA